MTGFPDADAVYRAVVTDKPDEKERSILCRARLLSAPAGKSVLLYFPLDSAGREVRRGDELLFSARLSLPENRGNPDEFDYTRYLIRKGISATAFVATGKWRLVARRPASSIYDHALDCRDRILGFYRKLGFKEDAFAVLSALTVGYKDELSESVRESFSVSGTSHVLALSGLHVGFLYLFLLFFLNKLPGSSFFIRAIRVTSVVAALWAFAVITGLSPSVVRSVIMFSLLGISMFLSGRSVSFHTLAVAALTMLAYNPCWLFDIGFQLSFVAVLSILFLYPRISERIHTGNPCLHKIGQLIAVSVAAQLGTAPLVLFYFSRYSVHFLLANIIVIPLVTLIMYMAITMLMVFFLPVVCRFIALMLTFLIGLLNETVARIEHLPFASIDHVWLYPPEVVLIYLLLISMYIYLVRRKACYLIAGLSMLLLFSVHRVWMIGQDRPRQNIVFYNVRHCPAVHCISSGGCSWIAYTDTLPDEKRLSRAASAYWNRLQLSPPVMVTTDYEDTHFVRYHDLLSFGGKRIGLIYDDRWKNKKAGLPLPVDYLYLCEGYTGTLKQLLMVFKTKQLVLDPSLSDYRQEAYLSECRSLGIPCISLSRQGSYFKTSV